MPVGSKARLIPFQEVSMLYFCRALSGSRGSRAADAPADDAPPADVGAASMPPPFPSLTSDGLELFTSFVNSQPIVVKGSFLIGPIQIADSLGSLCLRTAGDHVST